MANSCGTCRHYRRDAAWERAGICEFPMPPWVLHALRRADMRCQIVGQSEGECCPMWVHSLEPQKSPQGER